MKNKVEERRLTEESWLHKAPEPAGPMTSARTFSATGPFRRPEPWANHNLRTLLEVAWVSILRSTNPTQRYPPICTHSSTALLFLCPESPQRPPPAPMMSLY
jgi:hypothetical protein